VHSDFDDTMTAPPPVAAQPLAGPDLDYTVVPGAKASPSPDAHVWPADEPASVSSPALVALPTLRYFGFRIGSSQIVLLDAIAFIGRRPSAPRVVRGGLPRLVRVQSPTQEVSSTHLELRQVGSTVVAQDMNSTNGTTVGIPGHPVRTLRPGESVVVTIGTLIDIGDRNVIEILPLQERL
jgi:pSer/pThr/pTyr-binding forkhead associated (FHA) protein